MPLIKLNEESQGALILEYGPTVVGKTVSTLASCELPCRYIQGEFRGLERTIKTANEIRKQNKLPEITNNNFIRYRYDNYDDTLSFIADPKHTSGIKTDIVDSISFISNVQFTTEIVDEAHEKRVEEAIAAKKGEPTKNIASQNKQTKEGYGVLAASMLRLTNMIGIAAASGVVVICMALEDERQRMVNNTFQTVPLFSGKEYLKNMPGFFDLIGRVMPRTKDEKLIYPPGISFESVDGSYMAKWTGTGSKRNFQLDIRQILDANK